MGAQESILTRQTIALYQQKVTTVGYHLEVGVKSGWCLMHAEGKRKVNYTLLDKNRYHLTISKRMLHQYGYVFSSDLEKVDEFD